MFVASVGRWQPSGTTCGVQEAAGGHRDSEKFSDNAGYGGWRKRGTGRPTEGPQGQA